MVQKDSLRDILEYLKRSGSINTFKLARGLSLERNRLLNIIRRLAAEGLVEFKSGTVKFLQFPKQAKVKLPKAKKSFPAMQKKIKKTKRMHSKTPTPEDESNLLKDIQAENEKLKQKLSGLETNFREQANIQNKIKEQEQQEQNQYITCLKKTIEELKEKTLAAPKIVEKIIIKKVPVRTKKEIKQNRKIFVNFKIPKLIKQKLVSVKSKINFSRLNKNFKQLNVPKFLRSLHHH